MDYLLGIDNGGTVTKAAIYSSDGREIAVASEQREMVFPSPGHTERDMHELWDANCGAIRAVIKKAKINPKEIRGVAVTGHGNGMYMIDEKGEPSHNGIVSTDSRADSYVRNWVSDGTYEKALPTSCQSLWAAQPPAMLRWFKENEPETLERTRWILMCKDYVRFKLTGEVKAEITDYSGTNTVNVHAKEYDDRLFELYDIQWAKEMMPPLVESGAVAGRVTEEAARETGLVAGTPVAGGLFDITACAIGTGVVDSTQLCIIAGTWSINEYIADSPVQSPELFMNSTYCIPGKTLVTEASPTSASNLEWFVNNLMGEEKAKGNVFDVVNKEVESVSPEDADLLFLPYLFGTNVNPGASSTFLGLHGWHRRPHLLRAIYEGVAFSHRLHIDKLLNHRNKPESARIAGGAAHSSMWLQLFADALQIAIEVPSTEELGAMGAAMCAGVATGLFGSFEEAVKSMVRVEKRVEPQKDLEWLYDRKYATFRAAIDALDSFWSRG